MALQSHDHPPYTSLPPLQPGIGAGVDVCVVAAGAPNIIDQASAVTKKLGEVVLVAMITKPIPVYTYSFVFNEQKLIGNVPHHAAVPGTILFLQRFT